MCVRPPISSTHYQPCVQCGSHLLPLRVPLPTRCTRQISSTVSGLARNTTYHVRLVAQNAAGTAYGADAAFRTRK